MHQGAHNVIGNIVAKLGKFVIEAAERTEDLELEEAAWNSVRDLLQGRSVADIIKNLPEVTGRELVAQELLKLSSSLQAA